MKINEVTYNWAYKPGIRGSTSHLILHHAAVSGFTAQAIHNAHLGNGWAGIAYHYYITKGGTVYRGRPEDWLGGHTSNYNHNSIGICFEGNFETDVMPDAQRKAGAELVADNVKRYPGIRVGKHSWYNATACPGAKFPFDEIVSGKATGEPTNSNAEKNDTPSSWAAKSCEKAIAKGLLIGDKDADGDGIADADSFIGWHEVPSLERLTVILDRLGLLD